MVKARRQNEADHQGQADKFAEQFDVIGWGIESAIQMAKAGDIESARWLLAEFCATISSNRGTIKGSRNFGKPLAATAFDERLLDYLSNCFTAYLADKDMTTDKALYLAAEGKRGPKTKTSTREKSLARGEKAWAKYKELSGNKDIPPADNRALNGFLDAAFTAVSEAEYVSHSTVLRDYRGWRAMALRACDEVAAMGK